MDYLSKLPIMVSNNNFLLESFDVFDDILNKNIGKIIFYNLYEDDSHDEFSTNIGKLLRFDDSYLYLCNVIDSNEVSISIKNIRDFFIIDDYVYSDEIIDKIRNYCGKICELVNINNDRMVVFLWDEDYCDEISITFEYRVDNDKLIKCIYPTCMIKDINDI